MLHDVIPEALRPYSMLHSFSIDSYQMITSLTYHGNNRLITGSCDNNVSAKNSSSLTQLNLCSVRCNSPVQLPSNLKYLALQVTLILTVCI